jgi:hypothetical protein
MKFIAVLKNGEQIIFVIASTEDEARKEIHWRLNHPKCYGYLRRWVKDGCLVKLAEQ